MVSGDTFDSTTETCNVATAMGIIPMSAIPLSCSKLVALLRAMKPLERCARRASCSRNLGPKLNSLLMTREEIR